MYSRGRTELGEITVHNLKQLKRLNQVVFPVSYNEKFYTDILNVGEYAKLGWLLHIFINTHMCIFTCCLDWEKRLHYLDPSQRPLHYHPHSILLTLNIITSHYTSDSHLYIQPTSPPPLTTPSLITTSLLQRHCGGRRVL